MTATNFLQGEAVNITDEFGAPTATGQINFKSNGAREVINLQGQPLRIGNIIIGVDSGFSLGVAHFYENIVTDSLYKWDGNYITLDSGGLIAVEEHFEGGASADYRDDFILVMA